MKSDRTYEPPMLARVCAASALILGGSMGRNDSPVDPPTLLNGELELGLDD